MKRLKHHLLVFDRGEDRWTHTEFDVSDVELATAKYRHAEQFFSNNPMVDVILVASKSLAALSRENAVQVNPFESARGSAAKPLTRDEGLSTQIRALERLAERRIENLIALRAENSGASKK